MKFKCEECSSNRLEEVLGDVNKYIEVTGVDEDHYLEYGDSHVDNGQTVCYQCYKCGHVLTHNIGAGVYKIQDTDDLIAYLERQEEENRRDEKHGLYTEKEDIAN